VIAQLFTRFRRDRRGLAFAETAIALSVLSMTTLAGVEIGRYVLLTQKLDRISATLADLAAQGDSISMADLDNLFAAAEEIIKPFSLDGVGAVILSSVSRDGANPAQVDWQRAGGADLSVGSTIGTEGSLAVLPEDFTLRPSDEVIVAEIYYDFTPWIAAQVAPATRLYHRSFFRPRQGLLTVLQP
jgi:Flp pilus assembly protein TadG